MQQDLFNHSFSVIEGVKSERYGDAVKATSKLLKRPYMQLHALFTREKWSVVEIEAAYQNATKHHGTVSPQIAWWASRKRRNSV